MYPIHGWKLWVMFKLFIFLTKSSQKRKSAPSDPSVDPSFLALHGAPHVFLGENVQLKFPKFEFAVGYAGEKKNTTSQQPRIARSQTSRWLIDDLNCSLIHANLPSDMKKHETPCVNIPNEFNVFSICFTSRERSFCHPGWQSKNWPQHHCIPAPSWRIDI